MFQEHGDNRWKNAGYIAIDDSLTEKLGDNITGGRTFSDHAEGDYIWREDLTDSS